MHLVCFSPPSHFLMQLLMSLLANFSILSSGMGLGFPAITYQALTNQSDPMALTNDQASWFGKFCYAIKWLKFISWWWHSMCERAKDAWRTLPPGLTTRLIWKEEKEEKEDNEEKNKQHRLIVIGSVTISPLQLIAYETPTVQNKQTTRNWRTVCIAHTW